MPIMLSEVAANEIKKIIVDQNLPAEQTKLRVGVKGGGCSGFSYMLDLTEEPATDNDEQIESHGVKIVVDMKSYLYLNGVEIDFAAEMLRDAAGEDAIADFGILAGKPKLAAWRRALAARPSVRAAVAADYPQRLRRFIAGREGYLAHRMAQAEPARRSA